MKRAYLTKSFCSFNPVGSKNYTLYDVVIEITYIGEKGYRKVVNKDIMILAKDYGDLCDRAIEYGMQVHSSDTAFIKNSGKPSGVRLCLYNTVPYTF